MTEENSGPYRLSLEELEALPTLIEEQADDCKIDTGTERVWLSRCTVEDGEPWNNKVTVEHYIDGRWTEVEWWEAIPSDEEDDEEDSPYVGHDNFNMTIELGNAAMRLPHHLEAALQRVASRIESGEQEGTLRDENGNTVGRFWFD